MLPCNMSPYVTNQHTTQKVIQHLPTMHRNNITIKTIYISQIEKLLERKQSHLYIDYHFETQTNLIKIFMMWTMLLLLNITSLQNKNNENRELAGLLLCCWKHFHPSRCHGPLHELKKFPPSPLPTIFCC